MTISVWPVNAVSGAPLYAGRMLRQTQMAPLAVLGNTARPLGGLSGVRSGTPTTTVTATSTTWTCKPHAGILDAESAAEAGPYGYAVDANVTGVVTAANASNPRVDLIYARLSDPAESDGSSVPQVEILYLAGTAASNPSAPATPARGSALAWINVPVSGGGSPTVTWVAPGVTPGEVQFQTKAFLDLWTTAAPGQHASVINDSTDGNNRDYVRAGSVWSIDGSAIDVATPNQLLTTSKATLSGLSLTATLPAAPVLVEATIQFENSGSGDDRTVAAEIHDGATVIGLTRNFVIPFVTGSTAQTCVLIVPYTPSAGSHTYTVQANASINSAVNVRECKIEVTIL